jgi:hypothetical protein
MYMPYASEDYNIHIDREPVSKKPTWLDYNISLTDFSWHLKTFDVHMKKSSSWSSVDVKPMCNHVVHAMPWR